MIRYFLCRQAEAIDPLCSPTEFLSNSPAQSETNWFIFFSCVRTCKSCKTTESMKTHHPAVTKPRVLFSLSDFTMPLGQTFCRGGFGGQDEEPSNSDLNPFQWGLGWDGDRRCPLCPHGTAGRRRANALLYTFISYAHLWF